MVYLVEKERRHPDRSTGSGGRQAKKGGRLWKSKMACFSAKTGTRDWCDGARRRASRVLEPVRQARSVGDRNETFRTCNTPDRQARQNGGPRRIDVRIALFRVRREGIEPEEHASIAGRQKAMSRISTTKSSLINTISTESVDKFGEKWKSPENPCEVEWTFVLRLSRGYCCA